MIVGISRNILKDIIHLNHGCAAYFIFNLRKEKAKRNLAEQTEIFVFYLFLFTVNIIKNVF